MKFICQRDSILQEITNAAEFSSTKSNLSISANVYLETSNNRLVIKATDQKVGYTSNIVVETVIEGNFSVRCKNFLDILKAMPNEKLIFTEENSKLIINNEDKSISFNIRTSFEEFPELISSDKPFFKVPKQLFADLVKQTSFSISTDENKILMTGAHFEKQENCLVMVATDGKRLSYTKKPLNCEIPDFEGVNIPKRFIEIIDKLNNQEGDFDICIDENIIIFRTTNSEFFSTLISQKFPVYQKVIPSNLENFCKMRVNDFIDALKRVSLFISSTSHKRVILQIENKNVIISSEESDNEMAKEIINCEFEGTPFRCAVNYLYILDPMKVMEGEYFKIWFNDPSRAIILKSDPEREYLHVIMPMQVN